MGAGDLPHLALRLLHGDLRGAPLRQRCSLEDPAQGGRRQGEGRRPRCHRRRHRGQHVLYLCGARDVAELRRHRGLERLGELVAIRGPRLRHLGRRLEHPLHDEGVAGVRGDFRGHALRGLPHRGRLRVGCLGVGRDGQRGAHPSVLLLVVCADHRRRPPDHPEHGAGQPATRGGGGREAVLPAQRHGDAVHGVGAAVGGQWGG
mmetsp:Transcript_68516/g.192034  ORF Transcript_68516/g.192034 Transcript_68516/m.192034 type:complete len:204 (+) Transcript_68516:453-1064(+)